MPLPPAIPPPDRWDESYVLALPARVPRVLFATDYLNVPQGGDGAERTTDRLCCVLGSLGVHVAVACSLRRRFRELDEARRDHGFGYLEPRRF